MFCVYFGKFECWNFWQKVISTFSVYVFVYYYCTLNLIGWTFLLDTYTKFKAFNKYLSKYLRKKIRNASVEQSNEVQIAIYRFAQLYDQLNENKNEMASCCGVGVSDGRNSVYSFRTF